jgi:hypothetical protein
MAFSKGNEIKCSKKELEEKQQHPESSNKTMDIPYPCECTSKPGGADRGRTENALGLGHR